METTTHSPHISVIMGTYNCAQTVEAAINSVLAQTYSDFEIVVCDDCSDDGTFEILSNIHRQHPDRITLLRNESNRKLAYSLNRCLATAKGELIARMDADDLSHPERFKTQLDFLIANPNVHLVGTAMQRFDRDGVGDIVRMPVAPNRFSLHLGTPFAHATIMAHKYVYDQLGNYTVCRRTERGQDRDLWFRFFHHGFSGRNIEEPLYLVREDIQAIRRRTVAVRFYTYMTSLYGYRLLRYPTAWYLRPTFALLKSFVPPSAILRYRRYQRWKFGKAIETRLSGGGPGSLPRDPLRMDS